MITIKSLDKSHSTDVIKILIDSFSKNYDKKINESIFSSDEVDGIVALEKGNVLGYASIPVSYTHLTLPTILPV